MKLTANEMKALEAWRGLPEDYDVLSFDQIDTHSNLPRPLVRRTVRAMAHKGITRFVRGCITEDGRMAGSGYGLTDVGRALLDEGELSE